MLVTIGACATAGGIQAIRNWFDHEEIRHAVYADPRYVESLATSKPVADYVAVDAELRGCPISPAQLKEFLVALVTGRRPQLPDEAVCLECKRRNVVCVAVARGIPCLGPVTRTGCGAICPAYGRGCYGCFGPRESANTTSLAAWFADGRNATDVSRLFSGFTAWSEPFKKIIDAHGGPPRLAPRPRRHPMHDLDLAGGGSGDLAIDVAMMTRVEGEGSLRLRVRNGVVEEAKLEIFEAPRYFEQLVIGRTPDEVIDIVARICGICPIAYQMTAVHAFEHGLGIEVDPQVRALRRLMYCGEWIESHALHIYLLHLPDFLGYASALELAKDHRSAVEAGLTLKKAGNELVALIGGRAIHPVSVRVGGFSRTFRRSEITAIRGQMTEALDIARQTVDLVAGLEPPAFHREARLVVAPAIPTSTR